ncbi:DUF6249 domain-containing protein [Paramuribaculum intestinale]|uniref:DUF6249 domain-containing protein n=1 Tax=Paramuribaculum intestinale TaxID=2094151 RepID=UPI0025AA21E4|nr:DUF6249 domain-containing protein [Paramuribaculum intestinale]
MKKLRNLCAIALTALMVGGTALMSSCESDNRTDFEAMRQQMRSELTEQIRDELQTTLIFDSIGSTPIYISPSVEIGAPRSKVDGFREVSKMIAVFLPFVFVLVLVWMLLNYRRKNLLAKYRLIEYAIEKGNPLPDAFYNNGLVARTSTVMESVVRGGRVYRIDSHRLTNALIWIGVGIVGFIFFLTVDVKPMACLLLLPVFVGIAKLISYLSELYFNERNLPKIPDLPVNRQANNAGANQMNDFGATDNNAHTL